MWVDRAGLLVSLGTRSSRKELPGDDGMDANPMVRGFVDMFYLISKSYYCTAALVTLDNSRAAVGRDPVSSDS